MLISFIHYLSLYYKVPAVFFYTSTQMLLMALTSLIITISLGPLFIRKLYEMKIGQPIRKEECPQLGKLHEKKENTPTMGGLLVIFSILASALLWMDFTCFFTYILLFTTIGFALLGGRDDYLKLKYKNAKGLSSKKKFIAQFMLAGVIALTLLVPYFHPHLKVISSFDHQYISLYEYFRLYFVPFIKSPAFHLHSVGLLFGLGFFIFVIVGTSNAVNLTDGLDGLASGLVVMCSLAFAVIAFVMNHVDLSDYLNLVYIEDSGQVAIFLCAVAGSTLGFLWYNGFPAQVMLGDIGSLTLGAILGTSAVLLRREFLLALIGGLFVIEALSVIMQVVSFRLRNGRRIFLCAPIHHHFEYKGHSETKIVLRFWIIGFILAIIGLASIKFQ